MSTSLFSESIIDEKVSIYPSEFDNIDETILTKIKQKLEGYCTQSGYIKEVLKITEMLDNPIVCDTSGIGECIFHIKVKVNRCLPKSGQFIDCIVTTEDEHMGANVAFDNPVFICIINDTDTPLKIGDKIQVQIDDFQLKHGDTIINIVSHYIKSV
jgi:DNA-directed RNA polymerase subunit E'/Rpb7